MKSRALILLALLPTACSFFEKGLQPYYAEGSAPEISSLDVTSELGNIGGHQITIQGSGFGTDPGQVVVIFGSANAKILSVQDGTIVVQSPGGPLGGGAVDVRVGTSGGYTVSEKAYTYQHGPLYDDPVEAANAEGIYDNEKGYIVAINFRNSQYATEGQWVGTWGIDGTAEFLEFAYPRFHTSSLGLSWFIPEVDDSPTNEWIVQTDWAPSSVSWVDDLHAATPNFSLFNPRNLGKTACVSWEKFGASADCDPAHQVPEGSVEYGPAMYYDTSHLHYCSPNSLDAFASGQFKTEWPLDTDFFTSADDSEGGDVYLRAPKLGLNDVRIKLPEMIAPIATQGFSNNNADWVLSNIEDCFDDVDDADEETTLSDVAMAFEWTPSDDDLTLSDPTVVKKTKTWVRFSYTAVAVSWMGLDTSRIIGRASITVPDSFNYDEKTGKSVLEVPTSVLYQIPTTIFPSSNRYSDPTVPNFAYSFIVMERITEYSLASDLGGEVVFAYSTGDFGIFNFSNPLDAGSCGDCLDQDGDGWIDREDPDCNPDNRTDGSTIDEDNATFGQKTCNDGKDNDLDGLVDSEDPQCFTGAGDETNCGDLEDNDHDGWIDDDDPECAANGAEMGVSTTTCDDALDTDSDGLPDMPADSDGDGWPNALDPDCGSASDEELGFGKVECNDGIDNDGHGDVDFYDPGCADALGESETAEMSSICTDTTDNDGDGFIDANDPDCELWSSQRERYLFWADVDEDIRIIPACYDGLDNDADGLVDAADPSCWGADYLPDGFILDESLNDACADGIDGDGDGWVDMQDPDCGIGVGNTELGFGTGECNDDFDNDGDGLKDAEDTSGCMSATDPTED